MINARIPRGLADAALMMSGIVFTASVEGVTKAIFSPRPRRLSADVTLAEAITNAFDAPVMVPNLNIDVLENIEKIAEVATHIFASDDKAARSGHPFSVLKHSGLEFGREA
jgi:hypothetical protein